MIELRAVQAVVLAVWLHTRTNATIGSHSELVRTLDRLIHAGIDIIDIRLYDLDTPRPYSPDVSLFLERMQARGWIKRLTVPLQLSPRGVIHIEQYIEKLLSKPRFSNLRPTIETLRKNPRKSSGSCAAQETGSTAFPVRVSAGKLQARAWDEGVILPYESFTTSFASANGSTSRPFPKSSFTAITKI